MAVRSNFGKMCHFDTGRELAEKFGDRLDKALRAKGLNNRAAAKQAGVDQATMSRWVNNRALPKAPELIAIATKLRLNVHSLLLGEGDLNLPTPDVANERLKNTEALLEQALAALRGTTPDEREIEQLKLGVAAGKQPKKKDGGRVPRSQRPPPDDGRATG